jgi:hypothetical protein
MGDFLPRKRNTTKGLKGEFRGIGFHPIKITDTDTSYIRSEVLRVAKLMEVHSLAIQCSASANCPCNYCEFANTEHCESLKNGGETENPILGLLGNEQVDMEQELLEKIKKEGDSYVVKFARKND